MRDTLLLIVLALAAYLGFALLALSQPRNWAIVLPARTFPSLWVPRLRLAACLLLAISLGTALVRDGPAFGGILWVIMLAAAGAMVVATLTWRNKGAGR